MAHACTHGMNYSTECYKLLQHMFLGAILVGGGHIIIQHVKILTYRKSNGQQSIIAIVLQLGLDIIRLLKCRNIAMSASFHTMSGYFWVRLLGQQTIFVRQLTHQTIETSDYQHVTTLLQAFDEGAC